MFFLIKSIDDDERRRRREEEEKDIKKKKKKIPNGFYLSSMYAERSKPIGIQINKTPYTRTTTFRQDLIRNGRCCIR